MSTNEKKKKKVIICAHLLAHIFIKFEQCNKKNREICIVFAIEIYTNHL